MHCVTRFVIPFYQHFTRHQFAKRKDSRLIILLILHFISICCTKCIYRENRFRIEKLDSNFAPSPSRLKLSRGPGRKIRFAIRYPVTELDIARFIAFLTGIFQRKKGGGERSNRHAQIPLGRKSLECNPITTPAQSEIMLILVRYGIDIEGGEGAMYYWKETLWNGRRRVRDMDEWLSQGENGRVISKDVTHRW